MDGPTGWVREGRPDVGGPSCATYPRMWTTPSTHSVAKSYTVHVVANTPVQCRLMDTFPHTNPTRV